MFKVMGVERPQPQMQAGKVRGQTTDGQTTEGQKPEQIDQQHKKTEHQALRAETETPPKNEKKALSSAQMKVVLTQTWTIFNTQVGQDYATLTVNLPKKDDGKIKLSFVDVNPQHEQARNKATLNYQTSSIEKIEWYEDQKLNEKIMSSMLPVHRGSFFGPVYQFLAMLAALSMPLFFVTGWMLYLKRRKQKKLTAQARLAATAIKIDPKAKPWLIVYASQTGTAEQLAWRTASSLQETHQPVTVKALQYLSVDELKNAEQILWVVSTYGTGQAPDLASGFVKKMLSQPIDLQHLHYAILALGSREYPDTFCSFGHALDRWLNQNAAHALFAPIEVDNAHPEHIQAWNMALAKVTKLELPAMNIEKTFDAWTLIQRDLINPNSLGAPAFNIELRPHHEVHWQAGDIAEIQPGNSAERIAEFMHKHQIAAQTPVDPLQVTIEQALWNKDLTIEVEPFANLEHLLEQLRPLPSREYSIASIPSQQVLRLVVRQQKDAQGQFGLGSGWLTQHAALDSNIALRIRTNASFHLIDDNRPIICIGNGTGIAGLMSLLHTRTRQDYTQNWLIFGERQRAHDFFYQSTLEAWQTTGMLQRLDLAFSRDQAAKVYVHHILREQAQALKTWVDNGAVIYVCGSIEGMASDVDQALIDILAESTLDTLRQEGRYRRDVY
jgi:sulfite reductase (NADPH) flavoprotein alpha-component